MSPKEKLKVQVAYKTEYTFLKMAGNCHPKLKEFMTLIDNLGFQQTPNYKKLKKKLNKC
jgi:hypothetical protein